MRIHAPGRRALTSLREEPAPVRRASASSVLLLVLASLLVPAAGSAQDGGFGPSDFYRIAEVDDVAVSPDGRWVAFTVARIDEEENRRRREIWVRELRNGDPRREPVRMTSPRRDSHSPRWSPDGSLLSFVSPRDGDPNPVWFVRVTGMGGEAFHLEGVEGPPVWSPGGEWIAYLRAPPDGDRGAALRIAPGAVSRAADTARFDGRVVTHLPYTAPDRPDFLPHPSVTPRRQLFVVPGEGGEPRQLTSVDVELADPAWSEGADRIFVTAGRFLGRPHLEEATSSIWSVAREDGRVRRITGSVGFQRAPAVAPDGGRLAYLDAPEPGAHAEVRVTELDRSGRPEERPSTVTGGFGGDPEDPRWSGDGETLFFAALDGGARHLYRSSGSGVVEQVTAGPRRLEEFSFSSDGDVLAYVASAADSPPEVYVSRGDGTVEERATALNQELADARTLKPAERLTWLSSDSTEIEGWVIPPVRVRADGGHPLVLLLRDDRFGSSGHGFEPLRQVLSGAGFFVLYANPRGSAGYGEAFQRVIDDRWGMVEKDDLLAGVEAATARYPQAAADRIGVVGHGYGGFLATWLTATSDRFSAAVASAPVVNWENWFGTSAERSLVADAFGTVPWRRRSVYRRLSPLSYVENVTAPTLLLLREDDRAYPPGEAEQWFTALRERGVPTEMVRYPEGSRGPTGAVEPWDVADRLERTRSWLGTWLVEEPEERLVGPEP